MFSSLPEPSPIAAGAEPEPLRVCIQGYPGAFHDIAARFCFDGRPLDIVPALTFNELVRRLVEKDGVDTGLMAIENTLAGSLMANYKLLNQASLKIIGEVYLRIKQNLMALPGQSIQDLTEVHSHPIALDQCREYFQQFPHIRLIEIEDTALAAYNIQSKGLKGIGAIASAMAASMYGMEILAPSIETNKLNFTRFLVLAHEDAAQPVAGADKVSISFATGHTVGSLYKVLAVLAAYGVNLTKIQSAPIIGKPWEYLFFIDFVVEGNVGYDQAIDAIRPLTHELKIMGAYKQGQLYED
ncbi:MAG: prephenate dehydratase [Haliscomenobacter sp.]|nr:prephenate dehydratase [Haliscomenobacter sp.]MBK8652597.1 prephenate dehydratase [Haliscomenobacter sp.]MBP9077526.1 prephenate dehydratase [Haliscomenobacter sp.]